MKAIEMTLTYIGISAVPQSIMPRPLINSLVMCRGLKKNTLANQMHMIIPYRQIHFHSKNCSLAQALSTSVSLGDNEPLAKTTVLPAWHQALKYAFVTDLYMY